MMKLGVIPVSMIAAALAGLGGCMADTGQVWSTKEQSMSTAVSAAPSIAVKPPPTHSDASLRNSVIEMLMSAMNSEIAVIRANAIEGMQADPELLGPMVTRGLVDDNRGVRFVAAMSVGRFRMESLSHLLEPLLRDESDSVRAAAIYGLHRCGHKVDLSPLASMIVSNDPEVRANAAMVLGELGNPTAAPMIRHATRVGMERVSMARVKMVDLQMAEALVMLGEESEIGAIRAALFAPPEEGELTALACMMCGRLEDERAVANLVRIARRTGRFQQPAEVRMAATWALAHMGTGQATLDVPMEYLNSDQFQLRAQAALTVGEIGDPAVIDSLTPLLADPNPMVQVSAAAAILTLLG